MLEVAHHVLMAKFLILDNALFFVRAKVLKVRRRRSRCASRFGLTLRACDARQMDEKWLSKVSNQLWGAALVVSFAKHYRTLTRLAAKQDALRHRMLANVVPSSFEEGRMAASGGGAEERKDGSEGADVHRRELDTVNSKMVNECLGTGKSIANFIVAANSAGWVETLRGGKKFKDDVIGLCGLFAAFVSIRSAWRKTAPSR